MKKVLIAALLVMSIVSTNAQEVKFGAKAGVNLASIGGDDTDDIDGRTSFHFGGVAEIILSDKFSIQPELVFSSQGFKIEESGSDFSFEQTTKLSYLNLPILAKYYVAEGFSIEAGPQIGFLLSAKAEGEDTFDGDTDSFDVDVKDELKNIDFGFGVGLGYKLESGLNFSARYNLGLSNINDSDDSDNQNNVFQLSVGFMF